MKSLTILGASGSIGQNAIAFLRLHRDKFDLSGIAVQNNWQAAHAMQREFGCRRIAVRDPQAARSLRDTGIDADVLEGPEGVIELAADGTDIVLAAISGSEGLPSVLAAIKAGSRIALANKESLVCGGAQLMDYAAQCKVDIIPVDSEHSALYQCLLGCRRPEVAAMLLTASGGPFRYSRLEELQSATIEDALAHPNWAMGRKNSLDSATLANKGLELIEAGYLFAIAEDKIEVLINPSSMLHGAVQFLDGPMIAQIGKPDMRSPIGYALSWPDRIDTGVDYLDLGSVGSLHFLRPDSEKFPCLDLAREALRMGQGGTLLFNSANEIAGEAFLASQIGFMDIPRVIERCMARGGDTFQAPLSETVEAVASARAFCAEIMADAVASVA